MDLLEFMMELDIFLLFGSEKYHPIYDRISYLVSAKSGIINIISHNYATIKVDSTILYF